MCGDFNNVLHLNERIGSTVTLDEVEPFRMCITRCELQEHASQGPFYTWSNKQDGEDRVFSKIDWVLMNDSWQDQYGSSTVTFYP